MLTVLGLRTWMATTLISGDPITSSSGMVATPATNLQSRGGSHGRGCGEHMAKLRPSKGCGLGEKGCAQNHATSTHTHTHVRVHRLTLVPHAHARTHTCTCKGSCLCPHAYARAHTHAHVHVHRLTLVPQAHTRAHPLVHHLHQLACAFQVPILAHADQGRPRCGNQRAWPAASLWAVAAAQS